MKVAPAGATLCVGVSTAKADEELFSARKGSSHLFETCRSNCSSAALEATHNCPPALQVTVEYKNESGAMVPLRVHTILISTQHAPGAWGELFKWFLGRLQKQAPCTHACS